MEIGPLEILYSWQSVLLAVLVTAGTQGAKGLVDQLMGGKEYRQERRYMRKLVLPAVPLVLGALVGMFIPLRPEVLIEYINAHDVSPYAIGATYGVAVGQFADYIYQRFFNKTVVSSQPSQTPSQPPSGEF